jgi:hypothetical protein
MPRLECLIKRHPIPLKLRLSPHVPTASVTSWRFSDCHMLHIVISQSTLHSISLPPYVTTPVPTSYHSPYRPLPYVSLQIFYILSSALVASYATYTPCLACLHECISLSLSLSLTLSAPSYHYFLVEHSNCAPHAPLSHLSLPCISSPFHHMPMTYFPTSHITHSTQCASVHIRLFKNINRSLNILYPVRSKL